MKQEGCCTPFESMNIYAYHQKGYKGEAIRIQIRTPTRTLSLLGASATEERHFKLKAEALFALMGKSRPTALIQIPPHAKLHDLEFAIILTLLLQRDNLLSTCNGSILVLGNINIDGSVNTIASLLDGPSLAQKLGCFLIIAAPTNAPLPAEAVRIVKCGDLSTALHHVRRYTLSHEDLPPLKSQTHPAQKTNHPFSHIIGLSKAKKALTLAAAGNLNILLYGPPGGDKSLLLHTLKKLLPPLSEAEKEEIARITGTRPTSRTVLEILPHMREKDLVGGKSPLLPQAHRGVLLVDELTHQKEKTLKTIAYYGEREAALSHPLHFMIAGAMNGCPCANMGREDVLCTCTEREREKHWNKVGSAILDRFDICLCVLPENLITTPLIEEDSSLLKSIERVWKQQEQTSMEEYYSLLPLLDTLLHGKMLSMRSRLSVCKMANLIANFKNSMAVSKEDLHEALSYKTYGIDRHWR